MASAQLAALPGGEIEKQLRALFGRLSSRVGFHQGTRRRSSVGSAAAPEEAATAEQTWESAVAGSHIEAVTWQNFCQFLAAAKVFALDFDHGHALDVYHETAGELGVLDFAAFRAAVQQAADRAFPAPSARSARHQSAAQNRTGSLSYSGTRASRAPGLSSSHDRGGEESSAPYVFDFERRAMEQRATQQAAAESLSALLQHASTVGTLYSFEPAPEGSLRIALYDSEVVQIAYSFREPLYALFVHYSTTKSAGDQSARSLIASTRSASGPAAVSGQSAYHLCRATGVVPDFLVPGELADLAEDLCREAGGQTREQERYFESEMMIACPEDTDWRSPAHTALPGEPRYNFPGLVELLVSASLRAPPQVLDQDGLALAERLRTLLGAARPRGLGMPSKDASTELGSTFDVHHFLALAARRGASGGLADWERSDDPLAAMLVALTEELPALPPPQQPRLPGPTQKQLEAGELKPEPLSREELAAKLRTAGGIAKKKGRSKAKAKAKGQDSSRAKSADAQRRAKVASQAAALQDRPPMDKVTFYAKRANAGAVEPSRRPPPPMPAEGRAAQLELMHQQRASAEQAARGLACPATGRVLRLTLIDEPLRPPQRCPSPQALAFIEAAGTVRRLRRYNSAMELLVRARSLWAAALAGRPAADEDSRQALRQALPSEARGEESPRSPLSPASGASPLPTARLEPPDPCEDPQAVIGDGAEGVAGLPADVTLFFCCELASLCSAVRKDSLAARLLWRARAASERLPAGHPDRAAPWSGLCRVAFRVDQADVAARAAMRARKIREQTVGVDSLETATAYNNLACCLHALGRPYESCAYLEIAAEVLAELAGEEHPRTQAIRRNFEKARGEQRRQLHEVPHLFVLPVQARFSDRKRRGRARSKSGSRSGSASSRGSRRK